MDQQPSAATHFNGFGILDHRHTLATREGDHRTLLVRRHCREVVNMKLTLTAKPALVVTGHGRPILIAGMSQLGDELHGVGV